MADVNIDIGKYSLGWSDPEKNVFKPEKGLNEEIIRKMSEIKEEPEWMLDFRLKAYKRFCTKKLYKGFCAKTQGAEGNRQKKAVLSWQCVIVSECVLGRRTTEKSLRDI